MVDPPARGLLLAAKDRHTSKHHDYNSDVRNAVTRMNVAKGSSAPRAFPARDVRIDGSKGGEPAGVAGHVLPGHTSLLWKWRRDWCRIHKPTGYEEARGKMSMFVMKSMSGSS